jgi:hypothetical protein
MVKTQIQLPDDLYARVKQGGSLAGEKIEICRPQPVT